MAVPSVTTGVVFRLLASLLALAAVSSVLRAVPVPPSAAAGAEPLAATGVDGPEAPIIAMPPADPEPAPQLSGWSLRVAGWYIRVDGVEVAAPALDSDPPPRARTRSPWTLSPYDNLIFEHARAEGIDWRLVAAVIFEESRFNPTSRSDKGAYGLMQVRRIAAEAVGMDRFERPDDNIRAGVRYLRHLDGLFSDARGRDRLALTLAAYNMGPGHVRDAQELARQLGYHPLRWDDSMARILPLLERPEYYLQLSNGFAQGNVTVAYVRRVLERFRTYRNITAAAPAAEIEALTSSDPPLSNG